MALDEQLIARSQNSAREADNSESDALDYDNEEEEEGAGPSLREQVQRARSGETAEAGDIRSSRVLSRRMAGMKAAKDKAMSAVTSGARKGTSKLLKSAWTNIIESFGLTFIWVDIHCFLYAVFGDKFFCKPGEEWVEALGQNGETIKVANKGMVLVEAMGIIFINLLLIFIILAALSLVAMIVSAISNPLDVVSAIFGSIWHAITGK